MDWFPKYIRKLFLKNICNKAPGQESNFINEDDIPIIWVCFL